MSVVSFPGLGFAVNVQRIAFRIPGVDWPVYWYGLIIAMGLLLAVLYCGRVAHRYGVKQDHIADLLLYAIPLCIMGARLYYVLFYLDLYRNADGSLDVIRMIRIWDGGLAIYGAIITAIVVLLVFCRARKQSFLAWADLGSHGMLIGQAVGRWGNFVNVEAYGAVTDLPWRMGIYDTVDGVYQYLEVHPTFLYESLWNTLGFLLLVFVVDKRRRFDGQIFLSYIAWYGLGRFFIEGLRTDSLYFFNTGLRVSQMLAGVSCLVAAAVLLACLRRGQQTLWVEKLALEGAGEQSQPSEPQPVPQEKLEEQSQEKSEEKPEETPKDEPEEKGEDDHDSD